MTVTVSAWMAWAVVALALAGFISVGMLVAAELASLRDWWRDRRQPLGDEEQVCTGCLCSVWSDEVSGWPEDVRAIWVQERLCWQCQDRLAPLPPERSREELGFTGPQPAVPFTRAHIDPRVPLSAALERRAPWWEAEHRAAYQSLGLDYPSGLVARVRELAP